MKLYLVQHGIAHSKDTHPERPLTEEGVEILHRLGSYCRNSLYISLDTIYHSGKLRAQQTAEIYSQYFNPKNGLRSSEGLNPLDDPSIWLKKLSEIEENIMLVGHLPHLEKLALELLSNSTEKVTFQNGAVICLEKYPDNRWVVDFEVFREEE